MDTRRFESGSLLGSRLAEALPAGVQFTIYHLSSPPTRCSPIFAAPPGSEPARTYRESHFLSVAIQPRATDEVAGNTERILVFAVEVFIYTTATLTTLFVSKADSTGHLRLLSLPRSGTPSPLRIVTSTFISHLVRTKKRSGVKLAISLFARSQDQYLFPGSIENDGKHVLDDRGLIRWWCRVLDPVLRDPESAQDPEGNLGEDVEHPAFPAATGFALVPGLEISETLYLLPSSIRDDPPDRRRWVVGHPLRQLSTKEDVPVRCWIPHFPDDPKARFIDELDEELLDITTAETTSSPSKSRGRGQWKRVKSLEQFWEAMEFRQECSSGRLVGFLWVVFPPVEPSSRRKTHSATTDKAGPESAIDHVTDSKGLPTPPQSQGNPSAVTTVWKGHQRAHLNSAPLSREPSPAQRSNKKQSRSQQSDPSQKPEMHHRGSSKLSGPIVTRLPRIKSSVSRSSAFVQSDLTPHYLWSTAGRGQIVLEERDYTRVTEFLLKLDFAKPEVAMASTARWLREVHAVADIAGKSTWGEAVHGKERLQTGSSTSTAFVNMLNMEMLRRKRNDTTEKDVTNILSAGLMRKKPKA